MVYQSEFRHDSNARFVDDANDYDINDEGEVEGIVNLNEGFTEATESELFDRKVKSDEEAYDLYNSYAFKHGFGIRKDRLNRRDDKDRTPRQRFLVCSFAGFKQEKKHGEQSKVYQKRNFRTGCKAHIQFDIDKVSGLYVVVNHTMVHNHSRVPVSKRHLIRSHRKVTNEQVVMMSSLTESSIPVADAVRVLKHQAGGEANLSFLCRDAYGALSQHKKMMFDGCDAKRLLSYFKERKSSEYDFFYDFDVDEKGHLQSFFFRDNRMKVDYDAFDRAQNDLSAQAVIEEVIEECTARINLLMGEDKDVPPELSKTNEQDVTQEKGDGSLLEPAVIFEELAEEHGGLEKEHGGFEREHGGIVKEHTVQVDVKDPIKKRKKGQKNTRWKSTQEKVSNKLKGQKIKSWRKKSAKGVSKMKQKAQTTIKDFLPVPDGNRLAHSNEFGGSLEFFEPDDYFGVNIREL
uniref:FAR1 domain-containing protein n=1 Tax=Chenopodium quinoa TaxID=63459 RepID=A0A803N3I2_CHEQI